jgi:hypothetical protein
MEMTMTTEQALEILNQATAQLPVNRATHEQILKALETLRVALKPQEIKKEGA